MQKQFAAVHESDCGQDPGRINDTSPTAGFADAAPASFTAKASA
jgi:hypothetical protein